MTGEGIDWRREQARAGSHTQASLVRLALRVGWVEVPGRGKGSHRYVTREGAPRPVSIPANPKIGTVRAIMKQLGDGNA